MNDYWLAKLISSVDEVDSRKRLQKSVYLLQLAGCPLKCDYILHYYGPYSFDLAGLVDQLDGAEIIKEIPQGTGLGVRYKTHIIAKGEKALTRFEATQPGKTLRNKIKPFLSRFAKLNAEDTRVLELAATAAYFHEGNWTEAKKQTAAFKSVRIDDVQLLKAVKLAKKFKKSA